MNYVIVNPNKKVYIRLNEKGCAETCAERDRQLFEYSKARNILRHLPRVHRKFHFKVEKVYGHDKKTEAENKKSEKKIIIGADYEISKDVKCWVERMQSCTDLAEDACKRRSELISALSNTDKELSNCLHEIELCKSMNACKGYEQYRNIRKVLCKRRKVKDELFILSVILNSSLNSIASGKVEKSLDKLENRVFQRRDTEELQWVLDK